jgi:hypothetical protein
MTFYAYDGSGRGVARTINPKTKLGALPSVLEGGAFDLAFFFLVSHPQKPFTRPNNRITLNFDHSLQNT